MKKNRDDLPLILGLFSVLFIGIYVVDGGQLWIKMSELVFAPLSALPLALGLTGLVLLWYVVELWKDSQAAHEELNDALAKMQNEVEERRLAEEHAHILTATKNEIIESELQRTKRLEQIRSMGDFLAGASSLKELRQIAVRSLNTILPEYTVGVLFADREFKRWKLIGAWGEHKESVHTEIDIESCWVLRQGQAYKDCSSTQMMMCDQANLTTIKSVACYPIFCRDMQFGVLHIRSDKPQEPLLSADDEKLIIGVCNTLGLHFYNAQLRAELSMASNRDALTGLLNRRGLGNTLKREIRSAVAQKYEVAVAMIDIDHFKQYNDTYGHPEGDKALRFVAEVLTENTRARDVVVRYGGEEFMLILPNTTKAEAESKLNTLIKTVESESKNSPQCQRAITLSVGVACAPRDQRSEEALVRLADVALYSAKKLGRNRVVAHKSEPQDKIIRSSART